MTARTLAAPLAFIAPIFGTRFNDILAATSDGQGVHGLGGSDRITSAFNDTALFGGSGNDRLRTVLDGSDLQLVATQLGGSGRDHLFASLTADEPTIGLSTLLRGDGGSDRIVATLTNHWFADMLNDIRGGAGNDWITASAIDSGGESSQTWNRIWGNEGNDRIESTVTHLPNFGEFARNDVDGGSGDDTIVLSTSSWTNVSADQVFSRVWGRGGNDHITVNQDVHDTSAGNRSQVDAGNGNDVVEQTVRGSSSTDIVVINAYVLGGAGRDHLTSRVIVDNYGICTNNLDGGAGNDVLRAYSDKGADDADAVQQLLGGGEGNDTLIALSSSLLRGDTGNDRSIGSAESDAFMFDLTGVSDGHDVFERFDGTRDVLALNGFDGNVTVTDDGTDVLAAFANGSSILFRGLGNGAVDSLLDLVNDPNRISTDWADVLN
jgi:hypothetical protein